MNIEFKNTLPAIMAQNVYPFECAWSETCLKKINGFLVDVNGNLNSFSKFKRLVYDITNDFNPADLEKEYHNAIKQAQLTDRANCEARINSL